MATTVSAWAKPGAWALESEEQEAAAVAVAVGADFDLQQDKSSESTFDFPSLSAAATAKIPKKKKKQTLTLAELHNGGAAAAAKKFQPSSKTLVPNELVVLPTGPRERSAEELEQSRGFRYQSYGDGGRRDGGRGREDSTDRWGSRGSDESRRGAPREPRDSGPSRADEVDDWGATKKSAVNPERRERERERGFFDSQSRADESESWFSKKGSAPPVSEGRRERRGYELLNKEGLNGNGVDADSWGKKREENGGRPRLVLQPRTLPVVNGNGEEKKGEEIVKGNGEEKKGEEMVKSNGEERKGLEVVRSKVSNPFGQARPREEVLKEKGKDWKEIDEKLEAVKIQEVATSAGRKGFGAVNGLNEDRTERAWRKPEVNDAARKPEVNDATEPPRAETVEEQLPEN